MAEGVRARRERLRAAMTGLEEALASPAHGRFEAWREKLWQASDEVVRAIADHNAQTEADDGLLDRIVSDAPRLANQVRALKDEHGELSARAAELASLVSSAKAEAAEDVRQTGLALLTTLAHHRQTGSDLLYDAYMLDVGVAD